MRGLAVRLGCCLLLLIACGTAVWCLKRDNARLERQVAAARAQQEQVVRLRTENAMTRRLQAPDTAAAAIQAEIARLQTEIAEREKGGRRTASTPPAPERPRAPANGLTRLESFQESGNATPRSAMQSLMAAAVHGDDARAARLIAFDAAARSEVEAWLARLPPAMREKFPTPESIASLLFADVVTRQDAAQLLREDFSDPQTATVTVAFGRAPEGRPLPMKLSATGWQLMITAEQLPELRRALGAPALKP
jgi:hypothetical protein